MLRNRLLIALIFLNTLMYAQTIQRPTISASAGNHSHPGTLQLQSNIGELMIETYTATNIVTQGFAQPEPPLITVNVNQYTFADGKVFPNPVTDNLFIQLNLPNYDDVSIELIDMLGKIQLINILKQETIGKSIYQLNMENVDAGIYFVRIISPKNQLNKTVKVNKN
jgi:Secretion system C-terminal sorting domain